MRDYDDDVFSAPAKYYAEYRPKYPVQLFDDIVAKFGLNGQGRLLDLGCGTGELAIPLASYFEHVLALDPDEQMLNEGRKKAQKLKIGNIKWQKGSSKTLEKVKGPFRLTTMGQSFHWMDQDKVLKQLYDLFQKGGGLVVVGTEPTDQNSLTAHKDEIVKELITKYLGPKRRAGSGFYTPSPKKYEELLPDSAFSNFETRYYDIELTRNIDEILGHLFSMSWAAKKQFGAQAAKFENELRQKLKSISKDKRFVEQVRFSMYTLIKQP